MEQAACHDRPPERFTDHDGPDDINHALEICAGSLAVDDVMLAAVTIVADPYGDFTAQPAE